MNSAPTCCLITDGPRTEKLGDPSAGIARVGLAGRAIRASTGRASCQNRKEVKFGMWRVSQCL